MINKNIIVRIAEGLGNQLFMYAHAYSLSKKKNYNLYIDNTSGYYKSEYKHTTFLLDKFEMQIIICNYIFKYDNFYKNILRKILKIIDFFIEYFIQKKIFLMEKKSINKITNYNENYLNTSFTNNFIIEGFFESEKYFKSYRRDLQLLFVVKNNYIDNNNKFINLLKENESVSIVIRTNRYKNAKLENKFISDQINYVKKSIIYFKKNIEHPAFFVWSNNINKIKIYFKDIENLLFIDYEKNNNINLDETAYKTLNDFNLFKYSKHFIVGPSTFHWWGAWLNDNPEKICIRPSNICNSANLDYWPDNWIIV
jgi:hypothetical protein